MPSDNFWVSLITYEFKASRHASPPWMLVHNMLQDISLDMVLILTDKTQKKDSGQIRMSRTTL